MNFFIKISGALLFSIFILISGNPLNAVVIRHDRSDALYLDLGLNHREHIVHFNLPGGEGILIAPSWILTAAHVAADVFKGTKVSIAGSDHIVRSRYLHPRCWKEARYDIALVRLDRPVRKVLPLPLYRKSDEEGRIVTILGCGLTGNGLIGQKVTGDRKLRGAHNRIERTTPSWIKLTFDPPEKGLELEGISGQGDSGGPALIEDGGRWYVAGISAVQTFSKPGLYEGKYGVTDYYLRVSSFVSWIDQVIRGNSGS